MARKATSKKHTAVPPTTRAKATAAETVTTQKTPSPVAQAAAAPKIDHSERIAALIVALNGGDADVARESAAELGRIGNSDAVNALIAVIENKQGFYHGVVRAAAAESLAQLKDTRAVPALVGAIRDSIAEASAEAVRALATLGDERAIAPLIDVVRNEKGFFLPIVRRAAVLALAQLGGAEAIATLRAVASNEKEDAVIRQTAQEALHG